MMGRGEKASQAIKFGWISLRTEGTAGTLRLESVYRSWLDIKSARLLSSRIQGGTGVRKKNI